MFSWAVLEEAIYDPADQTYELIDVKICLNKPSLVFP